MVEFKNRTVEFKRQTRNLFFHILTACNLRCRHCYINRARHGTHTLTPREITGWLELFARHTRSGTQFLQEVSLPENSNVIFLGGEPTMHPDLPFAIEEARRLDYGSITIDTNGYVFNNILERTSPDLVDFFSFSLDGSCPEVNDPIRGRGSFDACTAGIRKAVKLGYRVSAIFTAHRMNIHDLENMPVLLSSLGVQRFFIQVIGIRGNPAQDKGASLQVGRQEWEEVVPETARMAASMGIHVTYPAVFLQEEEGFECAGVVADNYFVFPNGRVYTCPLCEDLDIHTFEIKDGMLVQRPPITEADLYTLSIEEGCVMNRILHPGNIEYKDGRPVNRIACCMLKKELIP